MRSGWLGKIGSILLIALCPGASGAAQGKVAMGRYMEKPLLNPYEGSYLFAKGGAGLIAVSGDASTLYTSVDGMEWTGQASGHDRCLPIRVSQR